MENEQVQKCKITFRTKTPLARGIDREWKRRNFPSKEAFCNAVFEEIVFNKPMPNFDFDEEPVAA